MLEKTKNSARRRGLQSRAWPIHDIVFGWYCSSRAVSDWASLAAGTCSALWWWQRSNVNGHGQCVEGEKREKEKERKRKREREREREKETRDRVGMG